MENNTKLAFSVAQFCKSHAISRAMFYLLLKAGKAPQVMKIGRRTLISQEAAKAWRERMENETGAVRLC